MGVVVVVDVEINLQTGYIFLHPIISTDKWLSVSTGQFCKVSDL